ncbi:MAG: hypothetical protein ACOY94_01815 [Bacillota bacterium]
MLALGMDPEAFCLEGIRLLPRLVSREQPCERLIGELLDRIQAALPLDAVALEAIKGTIELPREWFKHPYVNASPGTYQQFLDKYDPVPAPPPLTYPPQYPYPYPVQYPPQQAGGIV